MSAYMVDKDHIDALVQGALERPEHDLGFGWFYDDQWHRLDEYAQPGDVKAGAIPGYETELVPPSVLGQRLVDANVASVTYRYDDTDAARGDLPGPCDAYYMGPYIFERRAALSLAEVAKLVKCFEYQACEHPEWETSEALAFCRALKDRLLEDVPGYEVARWGS